MPTYADYVAIATTAAVTEATGNITITGPCRIKKIRVSSYDADGMPFLVRLDFNGIKTPQKYVLGTVGLPAVSPATKCEIDVDIPVPFATVTVLVGLQSMSAAVALAYVGLQWDM